MSKPIITNYEKMMKDIFSTPEKLAEWLFNRDCNCWECNQESPERCDNDCLKHMKEHMLEEYDGYTKD